MANIHGYKDKTVYTFSLYEYGRYPVRRDTHLTPYNGWHIAPYLILDTYKNVLSKIENAKTNIPAKATLYFDQSSKFPRFKLQGSTYKRCIKLDKADMVIVDQDILKQLEFDVKDASKNPSLQKTIKIVLDGNDLIVLPNESDYTTVAYINKYGKSGQSLFTVLYNNKMFSDKNAAIIYDGPVTGVSTSVYELYVNVESNVYTKINYDKNLDTLVSNTFESFDEESLDSIKEMLSSEDKSIVDMGLKLIPNYNVMEYALSISTILRMYNRKCTGSKIWNSASVKQLRSTIQYSEPYSNSFPACIEGLSELPFTFTENDKDYARKLIISQTKQNLKRLVDNLEECVKCYGIKINAKVES